MFGVRSFNADVLDQERPRKIILHLDQALSQELRKIIDERVDLKNPSLHLLDAETCRGDRLRPLPIDDIVPVGRHELIQRGDPPGVRSHFPNSIVIHVHGLFFHVMELKAISPTEERTSGRRADSVPARSDGVALGVFAGNGLGGDIQLPCAKSTPISRNAPSTISPSTNSPIVFLPITCPTSLIALTIATATGSCATSLTKLPSILMKSTGRCLRYPKEDIPAPKSSNENRQPSDFISPKNRAALSKLAIAAVSVISKQMLRGGMTYFRNCSRTNSRIRSSPIDVPEILIAYVPQSGPKVLIAANAF